MIRVIPKEEFIERVLEDLENYRLEAEHSKRLKIYMNGHSDDEIALACQCEVKEIRRWRKEHGLVENICLSVSSRKKQSIMAKGIANESRGFKRAL